MKEELFEAVESATNITSFRSPVKGKAGKFLIKIGHLICKVKSAELISKVVSHKGQCVSAGRMF